MERGKSQTKTFSRNLLRKVIQVGLVWVCLKGSVLYRKDRNYWFVQWYCDGKLYKISKYKGFLCRDGVLQGITGEEMANRLLAQMRADVENGTFRIEKYTGESTTDVIPFLKSWLDTEKNFLSPATFKDYYNSVYRHLIPWFLLNPFQLHEITYATLCQLLNDIKRTGKGKMNVMFCLHKCLDYAHKSGHIQAMPPFPEKNRYQLVQPAIRWLSEERQMAVINAIPFAHRFIFLWLKYHLRRPSEAMALFEEDYDKIRDAFIIRRTFSAKVLVNHTKTHKQHVIPCHPAFKEIMKSMPPSFGPFFFVNPNGRQKGQHYQHEYLTKLWRRACEEVGEDIPLYQGTKHSSCSQYVNEKGLSVDQLQMLTDHARRDSVLRYADVQLEAKRRLMEAKIISIPKKRLTEDE